MLIVNDVIFGVIIFTFVTWIKRIEFNKDLKTKVDCNCFGISYQSALSRHQITCKPIGCKRKQKEILKSPI